MQPSRLGDNSPPPVQRLPQTYHAAALSLVDKQGVKSQAHITRVRREPWDKAHPFIIDFYRSFQDELEMRGMPFYAHSLYRSHERQRILLQQRVTKAPPGHSPHNFGMAVDIVHSLRHWDLSRKEWDVIGHIGKEVARKRNLKVTWGGDWNFYDPAHWELEDWNERRTKGEHLLTFSDLSPGAISRLSRKPGFPPPKK